jgi:hypothetical protein
MMNSVITAAALALVLTTSAFADCSKPTVPNIPDGKKATQEQMVTAQKEMAEFNAATKSYLDCLRKEQDEAISAANAATAVFNDQANSFNAKNAPPKARAAASGMVNGPAVVHNTQGP